MKKVVVVLAILGVVFVVLVAGLLYGDAKAHEFAEKEAAKRVEQSVDSDGVVVVIDDWPLLLAVLTGEIDRLLVTADRVSRGGVEAQDLKLEVHGIELDTDVLWKDRRLVVTDIDRARVTGTLSEEAVSIAARAPVDLEPDLVKVLQPDGRTFVAIPEVEGRRVKLRPPLPIIDPVYIKLPSEDLMPCTPDLVVLSGKLELSCEVTALPPAVRRAMGRG